MTHVSSWAIRRPIGTTLLALGLCVGGAMAFEALPVAPLPKVDMPMLMVQASMPGASPETMASSIATPLERRFGRISGLDELTSTSTLGNSQLVLQFALDKNIEGAARDAQAAIMAAAGDLPAGMPSQPLVRKINPSDAPIVIFAVTSQVHSLAEIYDIANSIIAPKMSQVPGVGQVSVAGGQQPAVRVQADPTRLAHHSLTLRDVATVLGGHNAASPVGRIAAGSESFTLSVNDQLFGAAAYQSLILGSGPSGGVRLGDVAHVYDDVENDRTAAWLDGKRAIMLFLRRQANANIIETIAQVQKSLPDIQSSLPAGLEVTTALDRSATITAAVRDVEQTLLITVACVVLVVWLFLGDVRSTLVPAASVPLSLIGTFGAMKWLGYSLNNLSLMALTISTGFVVDDAIVVTENISRRLHDGEGRLEAALSGAKEISFTVVSMTASLLAVFLPLLFMGGVVGRLFHEFAWTLGLAVFISMVVSLTVTPMMCAYLLATPADHHALLASPRAPALHRRITNAFDRCFAGATRGYGRLLHRAIGAPKLMLAVTLGAVTLTAVMFAAMPKGLFPEQDTGMLMGFTEGPQDISFATMAGRQQQVASLVLADADVEHVISSVGGTGPGGGAQSTGNLFVGLRPQGQRRSNAQQVIARLRPGLSEVIGLRTFFQAVQDVRMGGRGTHSQYQYAVHAQDVSTLRMWSGKLYKALKALPELKDVATDEQRGALDVHVALDRDMGARLGVSPAAIDDALYDAFGQRQVSTVYAANNAYRVVVEACPKNRQSPEAISALWVRGSGPTPVPMGQLLRPELVPAALSVNHEGQFAATTLSFNLAPNVALGQAVAAIDNAQNALHMPENVSAGFAGTAQAYAASTSKQPLLILFSLAVVYIVLGVLYESAWHPLTILSTLPSAGVGALVALWACGMEINLIAFVGIILLIGIVKKNAIMMVDVAIARQRQEHQPPQAAIYEACMVRFRPIMMTTAAALLGALPLALNEGSGSELRRPLGVAIVGGLVMSQLLTLFTTPAIYLLLESLAARVRHLGVKPPR